MTASPPSVEIIDREAGQRARCSLTDRHKTNLFIDEWHGGWRHVADVFTTAQLLEFIFGASAEDGRRAFLRSTTEDRAAAVPHPGLKLFNAPVAVAAAPQGNVFAQQNDFRAAHDVPRMRNVDEQNYRPEG